MSFKSYAACHCTSQLNSLVHQFSVTVVFLDLSLGSHHRSGPVAFAVFDYRRVLNVNMPQREKDRERERERYREGSPTACWECKGMVCLFAIEAPMLLCINLAGQMESETSGKRGGRLQNNFDVCSNSHQRAGAHLVGKSLNNAEFRTCQTGYFLYMGT